MNPKRVDGASLW